MITYLKGDATYPHGDGPKIIAHVCNDVGAWGAGFVLALSRRWPEPELEYRKWAKFGETRTVTGTMEGFCLGNVQLVMVEEGVWVANMLAQRSYGFSDGPPIHYDALGDCMWKAMRAAKLLGASIHGPRFGSGRAGGKWSVIEPMIDRLWGDRQVFIYDL